MQVLQGRFHGRRIHTPSPNLLAAFTTRGFGPTSTQAGDEAVMVNLLPERGGTDLQIIGTAVTGAGAAAGWATFDGVDQVFQSAEEDFYTFNNTEAGFVSFWTDTLTTAAGGANQILDIGLGANGNGGLRLTQTTAEALQLALGTKTVVDATVDLTSGIHHIGVWWSPALGEGVLFVDGVQVGETTAITSVVPSVSDVPLVLGAGYNGSSYAQAMGGRAGRLVQIGRGPDSLTIEDPADAALQVNQLMRWCYGHPYEMLPEALWP